MSENKVAKEQNAITIDKFEALKDKIHNQDLIIRDLSAKEAQLKAELKLVKEQKAEKEPMVKVVTENVVYGTWGDKKPHTTVEYKNIPNLKAEAKEEALKEVEKELKSLKDNKEKLEEQLKQLNKEKKDAIDDAKYNYQRRARENEKYYQERVDSVEETYSKAKKSKDETIKMLRDELSKERNNKTDRELEKQRNEEIKNYKKLIVKLENRLAKYEKLNWFQKTIAKLGNVKADEEAAKEIAELKDRLYKQPSYTHWSI